MPLSIIVRVVSQVYEKCIHYAAENPDSEEEEMLCNVILSRYENMRLRIVNGGCDTDVGLKSIENSLLDVIVYEQQYQDLRRSYSDHEEMYSDHEEMYSDHEETCSDPSQEQLSRSDPSQGQLSRSDPSQGQLSRSDPPTRCSGDDCREDGYLVCRDETDMLNVSVNLNLSYTEFKNNIISAENDDNEIHVTYEDHADDDVDDIYS